MVFAATGRPAFGTGSIPVVPNRIPHSEPGLGEVEEPIRTLVAHCPVKNPADRGRSPTS